jgi:hypothetical protein
MPREAPQRAQRLIATTARSVLDHAEHDGTMDRSNIVHCATI